MADLKITQLTAGTPTDDDLLVYVDDPSGTPVDKKTTIGDIKSQLSSGDWILDSHTWVYASASTFTISGVDLTGIFVKGTRLRFKQGGGYKYAVVINSSFSTNTTVTIMVNTDFTIANATITDNYYSYQNPPGFPTYFNFNSTITCSTSFTNPPTLNFAVCTIFGNQAIIQMKITCNANSGGTGSVFATHPITPIISAQAGWGNRNDQGKSLFVSNNGGTGQLTWAMYDSSSAIANNAVHTVGCIINF